MARENILKAIEVAKNYIFGQDDLLEAIIAGLVCDGHLLIEGMPGLGKTMSVSVMSKLCSLDFKRIQFTPDLLPSDLVGTMVYSQRSEEFSTKFGPIFTQLLLADEINRSPAKVQSALLEAMAEKQVTIGEETHKLSSPFVVLATQNPVEQEGTYPLPEAQLDRFMMKILVDYPKAEDEIKIIGDQKVNYNDIMSLMTTDDLLQAKEQVEAIYLDQKMKELIVRIAHATRPSSALFPKKFKEIVLVGVSPRAVIWMSKLARYQAFLDGKDYATPDHLFQVLPHILGHRLILSYEAQVDGISARSTALEIARSVL